MNNQENELDFGDGFTAPAPSVEEQKSVGKAHRTKNGEAAGVQKSRKTKATARSSSSKPGKSKKVQLIALVSKPNGTRISVIVERLGWQAHTVRAALSGLRKQGIEIATTRSPKTGETVYAMVARPAQEGSSSDGGAS